MKIINKRFTLLKSVALAFVILFNSFVLNNIGKCNDYNNESLLTNTSDNSDDELIKAVSTQINMLKAGITQYSISSNIESVPDKQGEVTSVTTDIPTEPETAPTTAPADETFTVFDLNTNSNVTMNGYDLICQIVRNEVGAHYTSGAKKGQTAYDADTLKAFAIASYTYVKYTTSRGMTPSVGLNPNLSQALKDYVAEVYGQAIYYSDAYICAVYCASTGGTTLSSQYAWGKSHPYLVGVESKYDSQGKQFSSTKTFTKDEMKNIIESNTGIPLSENPENWLVVSSRVDGNYVNQLVIDGQTTSIVNGKEYKITGNYFRTNILGTSNLKSTDFNIEYKDGVFYVTSFGYGHGVGMPADGAELYATLENWNYKQILEHYYTGVEIK